MATLFVTVGSQIRADLKGIAKGKEGGVSFKLVRAADPSKEVAAGQWSANVFNENVGSVSSQLPVIDPAFVDAALTEAEMSCELRVLITYGERTFPGPDLYVLYRDRIKVRGKVKKGQELTAAKHADFVATITPPESYGRVPPPVPGTTGDTGEVEIALTGPGDVTIEWLEPYKLEKWIDPQTKKKEREARLTVRVAQFVWPSPSAPDPSYPHTPFRQYVNLDPAYPDDALTDKPAEDSLPARRYGPKMKVRVTKGKLGAAGDPVFMKVVFGGPDRKDADGGDLKVDFEGAAVKVGEASAPKQKALEGDPAVVDFEIDFKGYGGITATVMIGCDDTCSDRKLVIESWRKVNLRFYTPMDGWWPGNAMPEALAERVQRAWNDVYVEMNVLPTANLFDTFDGLEDGRTLQRVYTSRADATTCGFNVGSRTGDKVLCWYRMEGQETHPAYALKALNRHEARWRDARSTLHILVGERMYKRSTVTVKVPVEQQGDAVQQRRKEIADEKTALNEEREPLVYEYDDQELIARRNEIDRELRELETELLELERTIPAATTGWITASDYLLLADLDSRNPEPLVKEWSDGKPSYWEAQDAERKLTGPVTEEHVEIDKAFEKKRYRLKLPDRGKDSPGGLVKRGVKVQLFVKLRAFDVSTVAGGGEKRPLVYVSWGRGAPAARAAYVTIHEVAHILGFAPKKTKHFYNVNNTGEHCANGMRKDVDKELTSAEQAKAGTRAKKIEAALAKDDGLFLAAVQAGHFGKCVMFGQTASTTTEKQFEGALRFCQYCAPLVRVTDIGGKVGRVEWQQG